jgi:3-methyladenine DNA glycosylase AlkD
MISLPIRASWDGAPAGPEEAIDVRVSELSGGVRVWIDAPFHGDPAPPGAPGPTWGLWEHEVVELFVLGPEDRYTELEVGPFGHYLILRLEGTRNVVERQCEARVHVAREGRRWRAEVVLPDTLLPARPWRFNAPAIHGVGPRRYLSSTPLPGAAPDFHRLALFQEVSDVGRARPRQIADMLLQTLDAAANAERAEHSRGYYPSTLRFVGASVPEMRAILRPIVAEARKWTPKEVHAIVGALWSSGVHEGRQMAFDLLDTLHTARRDLAWEEIAALAEGNDNWGSVDAYACGVAGRAWNEGRFPDAQVLAWARSPDRWLRRTALASTVPLNLRSRGGQGDVDRTLAVCGVLAADRDDMVVKALSWALRSLAEHDSAAVLRFLSTADVAARVRREVGTKLRTGKKNG